MKTLLILLSLATQISSAQAIPYCEKNYPTLPCFHLSFEDVTLEAYENFVENFENLNDMNRYANQPELELPTDANYDWDAITRMVVLSVTPKHKPLKVNFESVIGFFDENGAPAEGLWLNIQELNGAEARNISFTKISENPQWLNLEQKIAETKTEKEVNAILKEMEALK